MKIEIKEGTKEIEEKKYMVEEAVTEFVIPKSVEKIGDSAFSVYSDMVPTLKKFVVDKDSLFFDEIDNVLVSKDHKKLVAYPIGRKEKYIVPEGIEVIGRYSFRMALFLEEIVLPKSIKKIEKGAFYYCKKLKKVDFGNASISIMPNAFEKCDNLSELIGTLNIEKIDKKAFIKCKNIRQLQFGQSIKSIGEEAFYGVQGTHFVFTQSNEPVIGNKAFVGKNIRLDIFKKQEKLLRPEIFAMNDVRKYSVKVCVTDDGNREFMFEGKLGDSLESSTEGDNAPIIKPILLDQIEGTVFGKDIRYNVAGFYHNKNIQIETLDNGRLWSHEGDFDSIIWFENDRIKCLNVKDLLVGRKRNLGLENISLKDNGARLEQIIHPYGNYKVFEKSEHKYVPGVYEYDEGVFLIDFTTQYISNNDGKAFEEKEEIMEQVQIWKVDINNNNEVSLITDKSSEEYKFVMDNNIKLQMHYKEVSDYWNSEFGHSKENYKKYNKYRFGSFHVPDEEESLCFFWKDSHERIFNYGYCVVFDKSAKGNIGVRNRSYLNVYDASGLKIAKVKFIGTPIHIEEKNGFYYVLTQLAQKLPKKSSVRLYKFML
ncbi:MAG: leucine-rich repeat domain-containing protein [Lachnospiraceae bacterium]|nr:leucine-rich repeat domain-containing protein [Lachnospiraceae bacterium]